MKHVFGFSQFVRLFTALTLVLGTLVLTASSASAAATLTVTKTADTNDGTCDADCSLREAIATASAGDTIQFAASLAGNTIRLGSQLTIAQNLTIDGAGLNPQVTVSGDTDNNGAGDVGVFYVNTGVTFNLSNLTVSKGYATNGAGIYHNGATLVITNSTFSGNNASSSGGGIFSYSVLVITNSTFAGNSAANGAAIMNGGTLTVANSTFSNNSASSAGGGIYNSGGPVNITNSTFSANSAGATFGGGIHNSGSATLRNTIIANSVSGGNCNGSVTDGGGNLVWGDTTCPGVNADPNLGALATNGGPAQTFALLPGSAAIDTGNNTVCASAIGAPNYGAGGLDQRGTLRPVGSVCDIGAFEFYSTISGNTDVGGVTLSYTDGGAKTAASASNGNYSFKVSYNWCGTVTPSKTGYTFSPPNRAYTNVTSNKTGQNYFALITATFFSVGAYDGWVLESTEASNAGGTLNATTTIFFLGDGAADKQYRAILHFNTASLPNTAVITKATLRIRKQGQVGTNPFSILGYLRVDMRKPFFGANAGLVIGDFQAAAGKSSVATFGVTPVSNWYSAVLNATARTYINKTGTTQFRLRFQTDDNNDNGADYMKFFSGNYGTASLRPTLIIEYYIP